GQGPGRCGGPWHACPGCGRRDGGHRRHRDERVRHVCCHCPRERVGDALRPPPAAAGRGRGARRARPARRAPGFDRKLDRPPLPLRGKAGRPAGGPPAADTGLTSLTSRDPRRRRPLTGGARASGSYAIWPLIRGSWVGAWAPFGPASTVTANVVTPLRSAVSTSARVPPASGVT